MFFPLIIVFLSISFTPTEQFEFGKLEVVSDLLPEDCFQQVMDYVAADTKTGLPHCKKFGRPTPCSMFRNSGSPVYGNITSKPTCLKDGNFAPIQCKGSRVTGRCFCFSQKGQRLFGQQWWKQAENMTCACSRQKSDMQLADDPPYFNSLHCNRLGNYEEFQCDILSGQCWCADEKTGDLTSPVVPDKAAHKLHCYKSVNVGTQYLRQCESQKYAQQTILNQFSLHGTKDVTFGVLMCDDDGNYGAYKVVDGSAYCTWRDNTNIGPFQFSGNLTTLNCNCARDTKWFEEEGKRQTQKCSGSGNYEPLQQTTDGAIYCVDLDGYKKSYDYKPPKSESDCPSYPSFDDLAK